MTLTGLHSLQKRQVHVWFAAPDQADCADRVTQYLELLDDGERAQARLFRQPALRRTYVVAHALVRTTLSRYAPVPPSEWSFVRNHYGRPEIAGPSAPPLRFNLSHTDGLVACSVAIDRDIGVDVEDGARQVDMLAVAESSFSPHERQELKNVAAGARRERFFGYWTLKEAYIKARGMGLSIPLDQFWFYLEAQGHIRIAFDPRLPDDPERWQFAQLRPSPRHLAALALHCGEAPDYEVIAWRTTPLASRDELLTNIVVD